MRDISLTDKGKAQAKARARRSGRQQSLGAAVGLGML